MSAMHTHPPDQAAVDALKLKQQLKQYAEKTKTRPKQLLAAAVSAAQPEVRVKLVNAESIKRSLRRHRRGALPKEPASLGEFIVENEWETTGGSTPKPFLISDNGPTNRERVVVFGTEKGLRLLAKSSTWYMDGNFAMAPHIFGQLYVIRAPIGESAVTCTYALLAGKSQAMYETMLRGIEEKCASISIDLDPLTIVADFELAAWQAAKAVFGQHVETKGCFFHLTQSTWRKIQQLGLAELYKTDENIKQFCGMLDALAFLPCDEVTIGMEYLKNKTPVGLEALVDYFDGTYVSGIARSVRRQDNQGLKLMLRRVAPQFPPATWNVYNATLAGQDRTNNLCEAWNFGFAQLIGHKHPSVWTLIDGLRKDSILVSTAIEQESMGMPPKKRVKNATRILQERLGNLCKAKRDGTKNIEEVLNGVAHTIRFF